MEIARARRALSRSRALSSQRCASCTARRRLARLSAVPENAPCTARIVDQIVCSSSTAPASAPGGKGRTEHVDRAVIDGVTLEYEESGAGEPVVCIHGAFIADAFRPLLSERGLTDSCRLISYHRRGTSAAAAATRMRTWRSWPTIVGGFCFISAWGAPTSWATHRWFDRSEARAGCPAARSHAELARGWPDDRRERECVPAGAAAKP